MADETPTPQQPSSGVEDVGGGALRVAPPAQEGPGKTLEEEAAEQAKLKAPVEEKPAEGAEEKPKEEDKPAKEEEPAKAPEEALKGTIFETLSPEMKTKVGPFAAAFSANGTLTDAEVTEAAHATGMSEAVVRQFMAGANASVAESGKPVYDQFGGQDNFSQFQTWTKEPGNLTTREEATINKAIQAGDMDTAAQLMQAPMERWKAAGGGGAPRDVTNKGAGGDGGSQVAADVYGSWQAVEKDMAKPEYRNDPAFRKTVTDKLARSPLG